MQQMKTRLQSQVGEEGGTAIYVKEESNVPVSQGRNRYATDRLLLSRREETLRGVCELDLILVPARWGAGQAQCG